MNRFLFGVSAAVGFFLIQKSFCLHASDSLQTIKIITFCSPFIIAGTVMGLFGFRAMIKNGDLDDVVLILKSFRIFG